MMTDFKYAFRMLLKAPGFTVIGTNQPLNGDNYTVAGIRSDGGAAL